MDDAEGSARLPHPLAPASTATRSPDGRHDLTGQAIRDGAGGAEAWRGRFGPFGDYIVPWFDGELTRLEASAPRSEAERVHVVERVLDLITTLGDLVEEGEASLVAAIDRYADARKRLKALRSRYERPSDAERLRLLDRADRLVPAATGAVTGYGEPRPLCEYLDDLGAISMGEVPGDVARSLEWKPWRRAARAILREQVAFTEAVLGSGADGLVPLIRDGLPIHLVARWRGVPSLGLPLGRSYLSRVGPWLSVYGPVTGALYAALGEHPHDFRRMWSDATSRLRRAIQEIPEVAAIATMLRDETAHLLPPGRLVVVETGLQATMPLLFDAVFPDVARWSMYTAGAWLLDVFRDQVFQPHYAALRPIETLACTDNLFQVSFDADQWQARETLDPIVKARAYWEIATLRELASESGAR